MVADVYNTTVNINGNRVFSSTFMPGYCCCGGYGMYMNSCFGFGYGFNNALGMGLGYGLGMSLAPAMPAIFKGIGKGFSWLATKVIAPAATFAWNNVLKPVGKAVWSGVKWVGKGIAKGAKAVGKAVGSLFHKKSKTKVKEEAKVQEQEAPKESGQTVES